MSDRCAGRGFESCGAGVPGRSFVNHAQIADADTPGLVIHTETAGGGTRAARPALLGSARLLASLIGSDESVKACPPPSAYCLLLSALCLLFFPACGYHLAGSATRIPADVKTIAVPEFRNQSSTLRIEQQVTGAVTRELLERTHYRVLPNPPDADALLKGTIKDVRARAITFDINTGRATSLQIRVVADVELQDLRTHKILFANNNYVFREEYQVSESSSQLFEEDKSALDRLSRDLARTLVTDILENF